MSQSRDLSPKGLAMALGQQYAKEHTVFVTFANKVTGLLETFPGAAVVEGRKNELEFKFLGRTHLLSFAFVKTESGFQSKVTLHTPERGETDGEAVNRSINYSTDGRVTLADHSYNLRDHVEAVFFYLLIGKL
jgi:hypothetical protein